MGAYSRGPHRDYRRGSRTFQGIKGPMADLTKPPFVPYKPPDFKYHVYDDATSKYYYSTNSKLMMKVVYLYLKFTQGL